jgi:hypothetical protein
MTLILLEALGAGLLLVLIVWWTMFSGREGGELPQDDPTQTPPRPDVAAGAAGAETPAHPPGPSDSADPKR